MPPLHIVIAVQISVYRSVICRTKAPSDEGAVARAARLRERKTKNCNAILSLRLLLRKIHLPHQKEAGALPRQCISTINSNLSIFIRRADASDRFGRHPMALLNCRPVSHEIVRGERPDRRRWRRKGGERVAAVDKIEDQRKPEDFIGHRNRTLPAKFQFIAFMQSSVPQYKNPANRSVRGILM